MIWGLVCNNMYWHERHFRSFYRDRTILETVSIASQWVNTDWFMRSTLPLWVFVLAKTPLRAPAAGCSPVSRSHRWPSLLACTHGCTCLAGDYFQALPLVLCWYQNTCIDIYESIHIYTNMRSTYENCTYVTQYSNNSIYVDIISNSFMVYSR